MPPRFGKNPRWTFQTVFAPQLADAPLIETKSREPDLETILALKPDVILTTYPAMADAGRASACLRSSLNGRSPMT
ncbi:hypothetical protein [Mesorhizobium sp. M0778]|uniref:hypothetical protein n=1 Tax=Mesorhizobium sp. M0778 TaxID=2956999 RepID=UPI00333D84A2